MTSRRRWEPMKAFAASRVSKSWVTVTSVSFSAERYTAAPTTPIAGRSASKAS